MDLPELSGATIGKNRWGHLGGEASPELLMCPADPHDLEAGAGDAGSERIDGRRGELEGTFVNQHWGSTGGGEPEKYGGNIVRGLGTGDLVGLSGEVQISGTNMVCTA